MTSRRELLVALGEGVFFGLALGIVVGVVRVDAREEWRQGTTVLAAWTVLKPALAAALGFGAIALAATPLVRSVGNGGSLRATRWAAASCMGLAGIWCWAAAGPLRESLIPFAPSDRPKLVLFSAVFVAGCGAAVFLLRALDLFPRPPGRTLRSVLAFAGIAGFVGAVLAGGGLSAIEARRAGDRPNVLVVCVDTMRADALGSLGGHLRTPVLDRLAAEGVLFEQATAAAPWTLPSHASLFTSRLPWDHGARWSPNRIHPKRLMLAERFREAGYRTGGFAGGAYVDSKYGFDQGFDRYDDFREEIDTGPTPIVEAALRWIRRGGDRPFFAFVHTYEPHSPYTESEFADPRDRGALPEIFGSVELERIRGGELTLTESQRRWVRDMYAGDVARADRIVGGMLETLRDDGILDRTIVVFLSDHGEDLWDHDDVRSPGHGHSLYQELLHVPLFVRAPGIVPAGVRIGTPVSLLDVAPTLLELCGLDSDERIHGRSLADTVRTGGEPAVAPVWAESVEYGPDRFALREGRWKAIVTPDPETFYGGYNPRVPPLEVFDLESDPEETVDLAATPNDQTVRLVRVLTERALAKLDLEPEKGPAVVPDPELLDTLRSLGYIQ